MKKWAPIVLTGTLLLSACGGNTPAPSADGKPEAKQDAKPQQPTIAPAEIQIAVSNNMFTEEDFNRYVAEPVKKKYQQITLKRINTSEKGSSLNELVAAGTVPDIIGLYPGNLINLSDLGVVSNVEELVKKHNFDMTRIQQEVTESIKVAGNQNYLIGLPTYNNSFALFYNKDVFDRFGVPYPKDGMSWEDIRDLAVKLTKVDNGVQYRGLYADFFYRAGRQLSLPYADFKTNKSVLNTDPWKEALQLWYSMYSIPGILEGDLKTLNYAKNEQAFVKGELAMLAGYSNTLGTLRKSPDVKWDMVTYPVNKKAPGIGQRVDTPVLSISAQSKNKDAAFKVLETILSDDVQTDLARNGRMPVINEQKVKDEFGKSIEELKGKNLAAMAKLKYAIITQIKFLNEGEVDKITTKALQSLINKEKDVNTALREADEELNKHIDQQLKK